jgi:hypothetical protein
MENVILSFLIVVAIGYLAYKATKSGMIDDALKFIKHEIFKIKR